MNYLDRVAVCVNYLDLVVVVCELPRPCCCVCELPRPCCCCVNCLDLGVCKLHKFGHDLATLSTLLNMYYTCGER